MKSDEIPSIETPYGEIEASPDPNIGKNSVWMRDINGTFLTATLLRLRMGYEESLQASLERYLKTLRAYERLQGNESYSLLEIAKIDIADALLEELHIPTTPEIPELPILEGQKRYVKTKIPEELRWLVWERDDFTCQGCGARRRLSVDHILAESKGGLTELSNLQTLCVPCNSRKGPR
jgi:hypothetical protein